LRLKDSERFLAPDLRRCGVVSDRRRCPASTQRAAASSSVRPGGPQAARGRSTGRLPHHGRRGPDRSHSRQEHAQPEEPFSPDAPKVARLCYWPCCTLPLFGADSSHHAPSPLGQRCWPPPAATCRPLGPSPLPRRRPRLAVSDQPVFAFGSHREFVDPEQTLVRTVQFDESRTRPIG